MSAPRPAEFPTTSWSLIRRAANLDSVESRTALAALCHSYWYPLYAYLRRSGRSNEDAEDLVQEFFAKLLEAKRLDQLSPDRGSFRGFLLVALKNFVSTAATKTRTQKRGGEYRHLPFEIDVVDGSRRYELESTTEKNPDEAYERRWALTLLSNVLARLRAEHAGRGDGTLFGALEGFLPGGLQADSYETVAARTDMTPGAIKVAVHRLRSRYRELLRAEVASLVNDPDEVDDEIRYLHGVLSR